MNLKCIHYSCILILLFCIELRAYYTYIMHTYFNWKTVRRLWKSYINPDGFSYGLWDISNNTIKKANNNLYSFMRTQANINKTHTVLHVGQKKKEKRKKWDRIIAIESDVSIPSLKNKLKKNGVLVCSAIVLKDDTPSSIFVDIISDFLCIPKVFYSEWKKQLETFTLVNLHDITEHTINPYHTYLFNSFVIKKRLPQWVADTLIYYFQSIPFQYIIAVCK